MQQRNRGGILPDFASQGAYGGRRDEQAEAVSAELSLYSYGSCHRIPKEPLSYGCYAGDDTDYAAGNKRIGKEIATTIRLWRRPE